MTPLYHITIPKSNTDVWAKLENVNPTGTHKDRSIKPWVENYVKRGIKEFAISSSGNSAISAAKYCAENNVKLHVFVRPNIEKQKISRFEENKNVILNLSKTPRKDAIQFSRKNNVVNLRASLDDIALIGYRNITFELIKQLPRIDNIFIPTSSGATLEGIHSGYKETRNKRQARAPSMYAVQTSRIHPIAGYFDKAFTSEEISHAKAIVDKVAHRKNRIIEIIKETGGGGFVISNQEIELAQNQLAETVSVRVGVHSALAFAGFLKWQKQNFIKAKRQTSVCLCTD